MAKKATVTCFFGIANRPFTIRAARWPSGLGWKGICVWRSVCWPGASPTMAGQIPKRPIRKDLTRPGRRPHRCGDGRWPPDHGAAPGPPRPQRSTAAERRKGARPGWPRPEPRVAAVCVEPGWPPRPNGPAGLNQQRSGNGQPSRNGQPQLGRPTHTTRRRSVAREKPRG